MQFLGYLVSALITLGGFIAVIMKFVQPINDLRVVIQKLNDNIETLESHNKNHSERIAKHGQEIDELDSRIERLETKMKLYHKE